MGPNLDGIRQPRARFRTLRAFVKLWQDPERSAEVWARWMSGRQVGSAAGLTPVARERAGADAAADEISPAHEYPGRSAGQTALEVWMARPWRWRVDTRAEPEGLRETMIVDENRWWNLAGPVARTAGAGPVGTETSVGLPVALMTALQPDQMLTSLALRFVGGLSKDGREVRRARGTPSNSDEDFGLGPGADFYDLLLDVEHGILLEFAACAGDAKYRGIELSGLVFDVELPPDVFTTTWQPSVPDAGP